MKYAISGFSQSDHKSIYMENPGVYYDDQLGVRIAVSKPRPKIDGFTGLNEPRVIRGSASDDALRQTVTIDILYDNPTAAVAQITHPRERGRFMTLPGGQKMLVRYVVRMGSAILCTEPGPNSGEMLFAYPSTAVNTDVQAEMMKVSRRIVFL